MADTKHTPLESELLEALKAARVLLRQQADAVCGNEQHSHTETAEFFKGYNSVIRNHRGSALSLLPALDAAIAKAEASQ